MDGVTILSVSHRMTDLNVALFSVGLSVALFAGFCAFSMFFVREWRCGSFLCILAILCAFAAYIGWTAPRDTIVKAVLSPDVDWGELAERYDVVTVEGQIFELREWNDS